jgi:hypothetical protein
LARRCPEPVIADPSALLSGQHPDDAYSIDVGQCVIDLTLADLSPDDQQFQLAGMNLTGLTFANDNGLLWSSTVPKK